MSDLIPKTLHFIWVGSVIPKRQAACILSWMYTNPKYAVTLWTNKPAENTNFIMSLAEEMRSLFSGAGRNANATEVRLTRKVDSRKVVLSCKDVITLQDALGDALWARYCGEINERNFGGASDILRIAALKKDGGVYLDTDSDALLELPTLEARDGIMFGVFRGFCNAVIAAPQGHQYLQGLMDAINSDYIYWDNRGLLASYRTGVQDARLRVAAATADKARWEQLSTRQNFPAVQAGINEKLASKTGDLRTAKSILQQQMSSGTLLVTGPTRIALWLYMQVGGADTPINWATRMGISESDYDNHLKMAELFACFQNLVVKPMLDQPNVVACYGFPAGYVGINSEASWIK